MFVELHILQNLAPSNVNRDDTGAPKECEFGGYRRARISSQALKRAVREVFRVSSDLSSAELGYRTKRLSDELVKRLVTAERPEEQAKVVVERALGAIGLTLPDGEKTQYLLFLGAQEIDGMARLCIENWGILSADASPEPQAGQGRRGARDVKRSGKDAVSKELRAALEKALDGGRAADIALFGRMLADLPDKNVDAASQVAHALSTNRVAMDLDYYTAVDDLKPEDTEGADMIGTVGFNSSCFYRYASVDLAQLTKNLQGDEALARKTVEAFIRASVVAIPPGKQNGFAAQNCPSLVFAVVRERGQWNLANAFLKPVRPEQDMDLVQRSQVALDGYWGSLARMYGQRGITARAVTCLDSKTWADGKLPNLKDAWVEDIDALVAKVLGPARFSTNGVSGGAR